MTTPKIRIISPAMTTISSIMVAAATATASRLTPFPVSEAAPIIAAVPRTSITLATLDPRTPPTAISSASVLTASNATASSGSEVPMATMVNPTKRGGTLILPAIVTAPCTTNSPPSISRANPMMMRGPSPMPSMIASGTRPAHDRLVSRYCLTSTFSRCV